jgi:hypothetical protein
MFGRAPGIRQAGLRRAGLKDTSGGTAGALVAANNLSDVASAPTARGNLGLGSMATQAAGAVAITGGAITGLPTPTAAADAATKAYVDTLAAGLSWKQSAVVASVANVPLATGLVAGQVVDGYTLLAGDRVLLKNQATPSENGLYAAPAAGAAARTGDANSSAELEAAAVFVQQGTVNANNAFTCITDGIVVGTTAITWVNFATVLGVLVASNNLSDLGSASAARANLGLGAAALLGAALQPANNLSDLAAAATARTNLGLAALAASGSVADMADFMTALAPKVWAYPFSAGVYVATTGPGTLATSFANGQVIDGYTLATGNLILVKDQVNGAENGLYVVPASGAPARHASYATGAAFSGLGIPAVILGTVNATKTFACVTQGTIVLGTTPLRFAEIPTARFQNASYAASLWVRGIHTADFDPSNGFINFYYATRCGSGSAGLPGIAFYAESGNDSGLYVVADNDIGWSAGTAPQHHTNTNGLQHYTRHQPGRGADIASATNIVLGGDGNTFKVTGANPILTMSQTNWTGGPRATLIPASAAITFGNSASAGGIKTKTGAAVVPVAGCAYDFVLDTAAQLWLMV